MNRDLVTSSTCHLTDTIPLLADATVVCDKLADIYLNGQLVNYINCRDHYSSRDPEVISALTVKYPSKVHFPTQFSVPKNFNAGRGVLANIAQRWEPV